MDKIHLSIFNQLNYLLNRYSSLFAVSRAEWKFVAFIIPRRPEDDKGVIVGVYYSHELSLLHSCVLHFHTSASYRIIQNVVVTASFNIAYISFKLKSYMCVYTYTTHNKLGLLLFT